MSAKKSDMGLPDHFSGIVRLFPLPNLVVFPGVVQALHIFEPRYRKMTEDAMAADQLIGMSLYQNEEELESSSSSKSPAIHATICICKVVANQKLDDGRYNLVVVGVRRARIIRELPTEQPYRMAEVQVIPEDLSITFGEIRELRQELLDTCKAVDLLDKLTQNEEIRKIISNDMSLGLLVDLVAFVGQLDSQQKLTILETNNVEFRCRQLIEFLQIGQVSGEATTDFPPNFSEN